MKVIPLTQGLFAKVDDEDYERLVNFGNWFAARSRHCFYARCVKYRKLYHMHRLLVRTSGPVDHADGDGLNNQKLNLRIANESQQNANKRLAGNNTSGYKGVFSNGKRWRAQISVNGKIMFLGDFVSKEYAAQVYDEAALRLFGQFALTNKMIQDAKLQTETSSVRDVNKEASSSMVRNALVDN